MLVGKGVEGSGGRGRKNPRPKSAEGFDRTRDQLAKIAGIGHDTLAKCEEIIDKAPEKVKTELRSPKGPISINRAYQDIR